MTSFQDYLASGDVNESVDINEADHNMLKSEFAKLTKDVESKLKVSTLSFAGSTAYVGMHNDSIKLYVSLDLYGKTKINQPSKSDHTVGTLRIMGDVINDITHNMPFIEKSLKTAKLLFDTYA